MHETAVLSENTVRMENAVVRLTIAADELRNVAVASKPNAFLEFHR
jgi:hypothetical protein